MQKMKQKKQINNYNTINWRVWSLIQTKRAY